MGKQGRSAATHHPALLCRCRPPTQMWGWGKREHGGYRCSAFSCTPPAPPQLRIQLPGVHCSASGCQGYTGPERLKTPGHLCRIIGTSIGHCISRYRLNITMMCWTNHGMVQKLNNNFSPIFWNADISVLCRFLHLIYLIIVCECFSTV